jgi:hypothetical protein
LAHAKVESITLNAGERQSKCRALAQQVRSIPAAHLELDHVMVSISAAELWKIFDEECRKEGICGLLFGDTDALGRLRPVEQCGKCPEDLTLWENVLKRVDVRLKSLEKCRSTLKSTLTLIRKLSTKFL